MFRKLEQLSGKKMSLAIMELKSQKIDHHTITKVQKITMKKQKNVLVKVTHGESSLDLQVEGALSDRRTKKVR